jgi:RNA polymerase sigma-70 factor, ECF subfamily
VFFVERDDIPLNFRLVPNKNGEFYVYKVERLEPSRKAYFRVTWVTAVSESELVARARRGERDAFSELVCIHAQGVRHVIYRLYGDVQLAEDAAQETFLRAWLHLESYRPQMSFRNWLYGVAVNAATDMLRKEKRILPNTLDDLDLQDPQPGPESHLSHKEQTALIESAVLSLPDACRAVLVLREYEGLSYHEIADALAIPVGTVMSRLNYARKLLKGNLEPRLSPKVEVEHV